jgi:excisionase family DNA binding protein
MNHTPPLVYRINVAEAKLGVSRSTIYRLIKSGELKQVKIGKKASGVTAESVHAMAGYVQPVAVNPQKWGAVGRTATATALGS